MRVSPAPLLLLVLATAASLFAGEQPEAARPRSPLAPIAPLPALAEFARARQISLSGVALDDPGSAPATGDAATFLVCLQDGSQQLQWLACLQSAELTPKEARLKPLKERAVNSGTGRTWRFPATRTALKVLFIGPFVEGATPAGPPGEHLERVLVAAEHLSYGLDEYARVELAYRQNRKAAGLDKAWIAISENPLNDEFLAMGRRVAAAIDYPPECDRIRCGGTHPISALVDAARRINPFESVLRQVLNEPSPVSVLKHRGISTRWEYYRITPIEEAPYPGLPACYQLGLRVHLNDEVAARALVAVTAPRPPLQTSAGIVGIYAEKPGEPDKRLYIRLLATRRAPTARMSVAEAERPREIAPPGN